MLTPTSNTAPNTPVRINTATIVSDTQHAVLRISAASDVAGDATITVTARDSANQTAQREFKIDVLEDDVNDRAFLGEIPLNMGTPPNTPLTIDLPAFDMEGDSLSFVIRDGSNFSGPPSRFTVSIDQTSRKATLTPSTNFQGSSEILIGVRDQTRRVDTNGDGQINSLDNLDAFANFDTQKLTVTVTPFSFTNSANPSDVDNNDVVTPLDALLVINELTNRDVSDPETGMLPIPTSQPQFFLDVNGDGSATPLDALLVINDLPSTEGQRILAGQTGHSQDSSSPIHSQRRAIDEFWADWTL
jgi:hypothetical protein